MFGADPTAIADIPAAVRQAAEPSLSGGISGVCNKPVGLQEYGGAEVFLWVPPPGRAARGAAAAEDAFIQAIQLGTLCR